jgi:hypothetical protein
MMVIHQVQDAENDRVAGLATWGGREGARESSHRLVTVLVPLEAASIAIAFLPLLSDTTVLVIASFAVAGWLLLTAATVSEFHARAARVDWLSFRYMPLADLYGTFAPVLVAAALLRSQVWIAPAWIAVDVVVRGPILRTTWKRLAKLDRRGRPDRFPVPADLRWRCPDREARAVVDQPLIKRV